MRSTTLPSRLFTVGLAALIVLAPRLALAQTGAGIVIVPSPAPAAQPAPAPIVAPATQPVLTTQAYVQPAPASVGYAQERRSHGPSVGLIVSGSVLLGVGWVANFLVGLGAGTDPFRSRSQPEWDTFRGCSFIPVVGPWVQLAFKPSGFTEDYWGAFLILDGVLQGVGTILLITAAATAGGDDDAQAERGGVQWALAPMLSADRVGLSVLGTF